MLIKKGTVLDLDHARKGRFKGIAKRDFKTTDEWYPIVLAGATVHGVSESWGTAEEIPCRRGLCKIVRKRKPTLKK